MFAIACPKSYRFIFFVLVMLMPVKYAWASGSPPDPAAPAPLMGTLSHMSAFKDRSTGTSGCHQAAAYIQNHFKGLGFTTIGTQRFTVPTLHHAQSRMVLPESGRTVPIYPMFLNAISPGALPENKLQGPLYYVKSGQLADFNGKALQDAIILMDIDSGCNWQQAASLGAKALIYLDPGTSEAPTLNRLYAEKVELSPIDFPRFYLSLKDARTLFGNFETAPNGLLTARAVLTADITWQAAKAENIYCLIPGSDPELAKDLIIVEAFYDSRPYILGLSPGADEALSITALLALAHELKNTPPARSVLLVATAGHAQTLAGMRELLWGISTKSKYLKKIKKKLKAVAKQSERNLHCLETTATDHLTDEEAGEHLKTAVNDRLKTETDNISRRLGHLRLHAQNTHHHALVADLSQNRSVLRRLGWKKSLCNLSPVEHAVLKALVPLATQDQRAIFKDSRNQLKMLSDTYHLRDLAADHKIVAIVSLHLSGHGNGIGAFNRGWLYNLKGDIHRVGPYSTINDILQESAQQATLPAAVRSLYQDTLRPNRLRSWESYFADRPPLGGEVSALAGYLGLTLTTVNDARFRWGTPFDQPRFIDPTYAVNQQGLVIALIQSLARDPRLSASKRLKSGFATVTGNARLLRHGELFADQRAPNTVFLAYQGPGRFLAMSDQTGLFRIKGVADRKHVLDKLIIEGYRFDPTTGSAVWAIDKHMTGKAAYRLKIRRQAMETDLVMFACRQMTLFNLLEPRSLRYMTKIQLLDGRLEAPPQRYWYSRIDTRASVITSIFLEPMTQLKLTLSDTILQKKLILLNADAQRPNGRGYAIEKWPMLYNTQYLAARDMWALLKPRIQNLDRHGIHNANLNTLSQQGTHALAAASQALADRQYDRFRGEAAKALALAGRVYSNVDDTQKDVLFGVLFYIALFVPFAFCLERLMFAFTSIHKRIVAFLGILAVLIAIIYNVHPAFELAYSPTVVILAFFIMGLSLIVTLIIFFRFEDEMALLQKRVTQLGGNEISRWKAFTAAFSLGVSNLRRRRLRTALTCLTLIILTFTIMSFTAVKTNRSQTQLPFSPKAPYHGLLLKNVNWQTFPPESPAIIRGAFKNRPLVAPRAWMESEDKIRTTPTLLEHANHHLTAHGIIGLSSEEAKISQINKILKSGRWLAAKERQVVLLPTHMAQELGIDPDLRKASYIRLWGSPFQVIGIFCGKALNTTEDLDGEPLTPVTFPGEAALKMTEAEMDALEAGEDVLTFQSRYQHSDGELTIILPYETVMANGGHLKSLAVEMGETPDTALARPAILQDLTNRFGFMIFSGESRGTFLYHASDTIQYAGVPNIFIPLLLSILIVLNTMISSVYERRREIGIYTSVGLAPSHVAFLFVAEAMAFAVLSAVLGYLLAQTSAGLLAHTTLWKGLTVNYSSLAGVAAMLIVILVVLVSVIYPSRVAARIAIPDVNRAWRLPEPQAGVIRTPLPFLIKATELNGIGGYLYDYFQRHQDVSHGIFSTGRLILELPCPLRDHPGSAHTKACDPTQCRMATCLHMQFNTWLAPFDLGIMQNVELSFTPDQENPGFLSLHINLHRRVGETSSWKRIAKVFINTLRKQLLIWRSLDSQTQLSFRQVLKIADEKTGIESE